jgi:signal peptidase I
MSTGRLRKVLSVVAVVCALLGLASLFHPLGFPGPLTVTIIKGSSMQPAYGTGALLVLRAESNYAVGTAAAYRVPAGDLGAGKIVIHRIIGGNGTTGFVMKGDNNNAPDPWVPKQADMVGAAWIYLPSLGQGLVYLHQPVIEAGLASSIMVAYLLARKPKKERAGALDNSSPNVGAA